MEKATFTFTIEDVIAVLKKAKGKTKDGRPLYKPVQNRTIASRLKLANMDNYETFWSFENYLSELVRTSGTKNVIPARWHRSKGDYYYRSDELAARIEKNAKDREVGLEKAKAVLAETAKKLGLLTVNRNPEDEDSEEYTYFLTPGGNKMFLELSAEYDDKRREPYCHVGLFGNYMTGGISVNLDNIVEAVMGYAQWTDVRTRLGR